MKFIKVFDKNNDYLSYRNGKGYTKPNVSLSRDTKEVHYNYPIWDANGHDYVDLGLPSGTLWATSNVGAAIPSAYGLYFQWGDTQGYTAEQVGPINEQKYFGWDDYKWRLSGNSDSNVAFKKYTTGGATLELEDDAAHANMGGDWHMPTISQFLELINTANTTNTQATLFGISGVKFTSKKDASKYIFFPEASGAWDGSVHTIGSFGRVWSSMLGGDSRYGQCFEFFSGSANFYDHFRYYGYSVRGVLG